MQAVSCILLLVERGERAHRGLSKALLLARHFGARLELLLCESGRYLAFSATDPAAAERSRAACVAEGRQYLRALLQNIALPGVQIGAEALCVPTLQDGVAECLARTGAQLIVKGAQPGASGLVTALDRVMLQRCGTPLLLTGGRPWRASPRFAAAVDLGEGADRLLGARLVGLCEALAYRCGAELDYLYASTVNERSQHAIQVHRQLVSLLGAGDPGVGRLQYCTGNPREVLPRLILQRDYDLLGLGTAFEAQSSSPGTLASRLIQAAAGDLLLLPASAPGVAVKSPAATLAALG